MFQARSQEALEVLTRCLQSDDERIAIVAAQAILDRGYGKPTQLIDASITEDGGPIRYYAELPRKADTAAGWLEDVNARRDTLTLTVRSDAVTPDVGVDVGVSDETKVKEWTGVNRDHPRSKSEAGTGIGDRNPTPHQGAMGRRVERCSHFS
jgi:hypothetical protein